MKKSFKSLFAAVALSALIAVPAFACEGFGCNWTSGSGNAGSGQYDTSGILGQGGFAKEEATSGHQTFVFGSGTGNGISEAGGQAVSLSSTATPLPNGASLQDAYSTSNLSETHGNAGIAVTTGNKNGKIGFISVSPAAEGTFATAGEAVQGSANHSGVVASVPPISGSTSGGAAQGSQAGFAGTGADVISGKGKIGTPSSFTGNSFVSGSSGVNSFAGAPATATAFIGSAASAENTANTAISPVGNAIGTGWASGSGNANTAAQLNLNIPKVYGSTGGSTNGQFYYTGNDQGNVSGQTVSYTQPFGAGYLVGTTTRTSVNVFPTPN